MLAAPPINSETPTPKVIFVPTGLSYQNFIAKGRSID
ncbi:CLUMA_CG011522, isoform A [Clunio marinus]|uniref:CLUMA_CG011522, isoform A n=1 Tax=Clunio marinus TaxID=568069 RepID=A0A1J1ID64_9DIPT|nr:CLUMA_CG011522, isoform A [Clunio marinus]